MAATQQTDRKNRAASASIDPADVARFSALADQWWNADGPFKPLHRLNPLRLAYIRNALAGHYSFDVKARRPLAGLSILDIGCGGGLLSEPLARLGARMTGADASAENIQIAKLHAENMGLAIDYRNAAAETLVNAGEKFDVIINMEVIEHVADVDAFLAACRALLKENGLMLFSTLNRTAKSFAMAIAGAEYLLRWLPRGTHDWEKFLTPDEMTAALKKAGFGDIALRGMTFRPLNGRWDLTDDLSVNYLGAAKPVIE